MKIISTSSYYNSYIEEEKFLMNKTFYKDKMYINIYRIGYSKTEGFRLSL